MLGTLKTYIDIPVFEIPPVMPRKDDVDIFEEGASFGGISENAHSIACTTAVASAHVPSTVPREVFIHRASLAFRHPCRLAPGATHAALLPPQTIVWWALKDADAIDRNSDFIELAKASSDRREALYPLISVNVFRSVKLIESLKGSCVVWGSWGHATPEECDKTGGSRGIPTNKIGHTHIVHFDEALTMLKPTHAQATHEEKLDYADPWTRVIIANSASEIAALLTRNIHRLVGDTLRVRVSIQQEGKPDAGSSYIKTLQGFNINFDQETRYEKILAILVCIAKTLEDFYKRYKDEHLQTSDTGGAQAIDTDDDPLKNIPMAVHASAFYLIEKYRVGADSLYITSFKVFPELSSTKAAPERMLGGIQRRPLGASK